MAACVAARVDCAGCVALLEERGLDASHPGDSRRLDAIDDDLDDMRHGRAGGEVGERLDVDSIAAEDRGEAAGLLIEVRSRHGGSRASATNGGEGGASGGLRLAEHVATLIDTANR